MLSTDRDLSIRKRYLPLEQSGPLQVLLSCCGCLVPAWDDRIHLAFVQRLYRSNVVTHQTRGTTVLSLQFPELVELRKEEKIFSLWPLSNRNSTTISFSTVFFWRLGLQTKKQMVDFCVFGRHENVEELLGLARKRQKLIEQLKPVTVTCIKLVVGWNPSN